MRSFYANITDTPREDHMQSYLAFLGARNGTINPESPYPKREAWLQEAEHWAARHPGLDKAHFERNFTTYQPETSNDLAEVALLAYVKMNAGEAYGVRVVSAHRQRVRSSEGTFAQLERLVTQEENYHTRILLGATAQFDLPAPQSAWIPPLSQKMLIGGLAYAPNAVFHPILLAAEIFGVFTFSWVLRRVGEVFVAEPALRETLERRLIEVLTDEIGHIAFNRMAVGPRGLAAAKALAPLIAAQVNGQSPEFKALGWNSSITKEFENFDLASLPEETRAHGFFV